MKGKIIFTNADHDKVEDRIFPALKVPGAKEIHVSDKQVNEYVRFGVAITQSSCYELSRIEPERRHELLKSLYSKEGLGLSIGRICIGSSDYSPEIYTYDDVDGDVELKHFSIERDLEYVIPIIKEIVEINPDIYLFASPWTPPGWMKTAGYLYGGYMLDEYIDCYAEYIIKFINAYAEHGIKISAITPQNEPNTPQYNQMAACVWHPRTEANFIKVLRNKLDERKMNVEIWMHDHNFIDVHRVIWELDKCEGTREAVDAVAFHYYMGAIEETLVLNEKYPELPLHFTEAGPRLTDNYDTDWCKWGLMAIKAIKCGYKTFTGWNLMLDELGGPNIGRYLGTCGGFVTRDNRNGELNFSGQYKAFGHIVPYLTNNSKVYPVYVGEAFEYDMSRFPRCDHKIDGIVIDNGDGKLVAVLVNPGQTRIQTQIKLKGEYWYIEIQANSVSTVVVE